MQVETLFISLAEPNDYDFTDQKTGRHLQGTSYKMGIWSGNPTEMPGEVKLADSDVHQRVKRLKLQTLEPIMLTYHTDIRNGRPYLGKIVAVDRVKDAVAA
jgi:hypothetical protein